MDAANATGRPGRRFRFAEALSFGAIPVVYGDDWVLPFSELVDPRNYCVVIREGDVLHTRNVLRAVGPDRADRLQAAGLAVFRRYFADVDRQLDGLLEIFARRAATPEHRTHAVAVDIAEPWDAALDADERALLDNIQRDLDPDGQAPHLFDALRGRGA